MPNINTLVLNDGQTTPVAHTFSLKTIENGLGLLRDGAAATVATAPVLTLQKKSSNNSIVERTPVSLAVPFIDAVDGKTYYARFKGEYLLPTNAPLQVRKDLFAYSRNLAAHATLQSMVVDSEGVW